jgi:hypothetical protein
MTSLLALNTIRGSILAEPLLSLDSSEKMRKREELRGASWTFAIRIVGDNQGKTLMKLGGRILGYYRCNTQYGGVPNRKEKQGVTSHVHPRANLPWIG